MIDEIRKDKLKQDLTKFWASERASEQISIMHDILNHCRVLHLEPKILLMPSVVEIRNAMPVAVPPPLPPKLGVVNDSYGCPYCEYVANNNVGLKAHLGIKHKDLKPEWSGKY